MTEYIRVSDLNKCETCRHHRTGSCDTWCDYGEEYQIDWSKVKKVDAVEVVRCKDCKHFVDAKGKDSGKPCGYGQ